MTFKKINEFTVQCVMEVNEIDQMGYVLQELYTNKEAASKFMRNVMEKGEEAGFSLNQNLQEIQVVLLPGDQLMLSFTQVSPNFQVNQMIENAMEAHAAVEAIGKERLDEIMNMSGKEKLLAFQEIMAKYKGMAEAFSQKEESNEGVMNLEKVDTEYKQKKLMFQFSNLSHLEKLCKSVTIKVPSNLYKDGKQYYLLADFAGMEKEKIDNFLLQALDYEAKIEKNKLVMAHVEEHASNMIENKAIEVLKKMSL